MVQYWRIGISSTWKFFSCPISKNNLDINNIVVSNELLFGKQGSKYFIGYKDAEEIRPLCIFRTKMSIYKRHFGKTRCMYFSIKDEKF